MDYGAHKYLYMRKKYLTIPWGDLLLFIAVYSGILPVHGLSQLSAHHNNVCFCLEISPAI